MKMRLIFIILLIFFSEWSLYAQTTWVDSLITHLKTDKDRNFYGLSLNQDTLKILTTKAYTYYPFGEFNKPSKLISFLGDQFRLSYIQVFTYCDTNGQVDTLFRFRSKSSIIDFFYQGFYGEDPPLMQIAKASINGSDVSLINGVKVGMALADVFKIVIGCKMPYAAHSINIIVADRALYGLTFYFCFNKQKLVRIIISAAFKYCEKQ